MDVLLSCLLIGSSTILYSFIWFYPNIFSNIIGSENNPVHLLSQLSMFLKVLQLISITFLFENIYLIGLHSSIMTILTENVTVTFFCSLLFLTGQFMNLSVYQALTLDGVYYGAVFGQKIKWVSGWPYKLFNIISLPDPQYQGCILSLLSLLFLIYQKQPKLTIVFIFWILNYIILIILEKTPSGNIVIKNVKN
jgi:hypothetical protein